MVAAVLPPRGEKEQLLARKKKLEMQLEKHTPTKHPPTDTRPVTEWDYKERTNIFTSTAWGEGGESVCVCVCVCRTPSAVECAQQTLPRTPPLQPPHHTTAAARPTRGTRHRHTHPTAPHESPSFHWTFPQQPFALFLPYTRHTLPLSRCTAPPLHKQHFLPIQRDTYGKVCRYIHVHTQVICM